MDRAPQRLRRPAARGRERDARPAAGRIPARKKHRVEWTDPKEATVWLAVYARANA
jgi:hypothetical protein